MKITAETRALENGLILYDAAQGGKIHDHIFTPLYWRTRDCLGEPLGGRGAAWRIQDEGIDWVLRFYRRGGLVGKFILDWYFYTGLERSRPWREWNLTARLHEEGLPVPRPVAARIIPFALGYRAAIITETVPGKSMSGLLADNALNDMQWQAIGKAIRKLHDAGAWHADLNAHNILVDGDVITVIDWDRGEIRSQDTAWREANLSRLLRSLHKITPEDKHASIDAKWILLREAYNG